MIERRLGSTYYSNENDCEYCVVRGRINSCYGCCFSDWDENGECECCKPNDAGVCVAEDRNDGIDVIFKEA